MKFLYFLLALISLGSWASPSFDEVRWNLLADEWILSANKLEKYDIFPLDEEITFYDNPQLEGSSKFRLLAHFVTFEDGESCVLRRKTQSIKSNIFLSCYSYHCDVESSKVSEVKNILNPWKYSWYKYSNQKNMSDLCSRQLEAFIYTRKSELLSMIPYLYLPAGDKSVSLNGKKYHSKFETCKRDKYRSTCHYNLASSQDDQGLNSEITKNKNYIPHNNLNSIKKCFLEKNPEKCVVANTFTTEKPIKEFIHLSRQSIIEPEFRTIQWNPELLIELKACLEKDKSVGPNFFKGIHKKCRFYHDKIMYIDYPEAFVKFEPLWFEGINLLHNSKP